MTPSNLRSVIDEVDQRCASYSLRISALNKSIDREHNLSDRKDYAHIDRMESERTKLRMELDLERRILAFLEPLDDFTDQTPPPGMEAEAELICAKALETGRSWYLLSVLSRGGVAGIVGDDLMLGSPDQCRLDLGDLGDDAERSAA